MTTCGVDILSEPDPSKSAGRNRHCEPRDALAPMMGVLCLRRPDEGREHRAPAVAFRNCCRSTCICEPCTSSCSEIADRDEHRNKTGDTAARSARLLLWDAGEEGPGRQHLASGRRPAAHRHELVKFLVLPTNSLFRRKNSLFR